MDEKLEKILWKKTLFTEFRTADKIFYNRLDNYPEDAKYYDLPELGGIGSKFIGRKMKRE